VRRWLILDRDGVINEDSEAFIRSPEELVPIPGSAEAIGRLCQAGWIVTVATNQSGLARGLFDQATLARIHERLEQIIGQSGGRIERLVYCPHGPDDACACRKPRPGLYQQLACELGRSLDRTPVIGDSPRDLEAAVAVGAQPILVRTGKGDQTYLNGRYPAGTRVYRDLATAANALLNER